MLQVAHRRHPEVATEASNGRPRTRRHAFRPPGSGVWQTWPGLLTRSRYGGRHRRPYGPPFMNYSAGPRIRSLDQRTFQVAAMKTPGRMSSARAISSQLMYPHGAPGTRRRRRASISDRRKGIDQPLQHLLQDAHLPCSRSPACSLRQSPGDAFSSALVGRDSHPQRTSGAAAPARSCSPLN